MARASDGTYTRVSNSFSSPSSGTPLSSTHAEALFDDIESEITDSYSRSIKGGMLANGTNSAPAFTWTADLNTGIYRIGADNLGITAGGTKMIDVTTTTVGLTGNLLLGSAAVINFNSGNYTVTHSAGELAFSGIVTLTNSGLHILDSNATHDLIITPGSNLSADRVFTLTTGDAARTLDISAASVTVSSFGATLVDDADAGTAQTTLGISTFVKTILDDADAAAVRATIGVGLGTGDLVAANNLSDVSSADTSRTNLGIQYTLIDVQIFTASGTWTKPTGTDAVEVWTVGGGGGGGGADADSATAGMGGGGGAGGIAYEWIDSGLGATETVTVGTGGAGGAAGNNAGTAGVTSSFGAHNSATGGDGGTSVANGSGFSWVAGGAGGIGSGGDMNIAGGCGTKGFRLSATVPVAGEGGSNMFGGGGVNNNSGNAVGVAGRGYGGGGSGGSAHSTTTDRAGGAGADGVVIVKSYKL